MAFKDHIVLDDLGQRLFDAMSKMPVIDAHEHLRAWLYGNPERFYGL